MTVACARQEYSLLCQRPELVRWPLALPSPEGNLVGGVQGGVLPPPPRCAWQGRGGGYLCQTSRAGVGAAGQAGGCGLSPDESERLHGCRSRPAWPWCAHPQSPSQVYLSIWRIGEVCRPLPPKCHGSSHPFYCMCLSHICVTINCVFRTDRSSVFLLGIWYL